MERHCIIFSVISLYAYNCFVDSDENSMGTNRVAYPAGTHSVKNEVTRVIFISPRYDASARRLTPGIKLAGPYL